MGNLSARDVAVAITAPLVMGMGLVIAKSATNHFTPVLLGAVLGGAGISTLPPSPKTQD